ncbi:MAG: YncE family protein, partial [Candidatus Eremiobacterota bacterium]
KIKKKEESKVKKVQPKQVVGKELEGWHQTIWWKINTNPVLGNRGVQAGILIVMIIIIYMLWLKKEVLIPSLSVKNNPPALIYSLQERNNIDTINLNTAKVSSMEINQQLIDAVYSNEMSCIYAITAQEKLVEIIPGTYKIKREKSLGREPSTIRLSTNKKTVYITNQRSDNLSVIDLVNLKDIINPILVGSGPITSALSPDGKVLYILNSRQNSICFFNTESNTIIGSITVAQEEKDLTANFDNSKLYTVNYNSNKVKIIDLKSKKILNTISIEGGPAAIAANSMGDEFYVIADKTKELLYLNINGVIKDRYSLDFIPINIKTGVSGRKLFITGCSLSGYVIAEFDTLNKKINILTQPDKKPSFILPIYNW